jgi:Dolichyl-phosphate-mannose-protein mannosyltransferase
VVRAWQDDPGQIWTVARVASALLSTAAIPLLYVAGKRMFDRWVGLVAAAVLATAFLPVHYGHLALNDAPSLAPTALALIGIAGVLKTGRLGEYALAGVGLGIAVGFKYNAAFVLLPLLGAALVVAFRDRRAVPVLLGLLFAGAAAAVAFVLCDPYALLRPGFFHEQLQKLSAYTRGDLLLGETQRSGYRYYAWSLLWGFGLIPLALAVAGGVRTILRERAQAIVLVPATLLFFPVIGSQGRYFARYGMPVYPMLALLAGVGAVWIGRALPARRILVPVGVALICLEGLVLTVHNDLVLSKQDTRSAAREWMVEHIPAGTQIAVEPLVPKEWYADGARLPDPTKRTGYRWQRFVRTSADAKRLAKQFPGARRKADFANYVATVFPGQIDFLRSKGVCWIVSGSTQSGRAFNNPERVPQAIKYYKALNREADLRYRIAPFAGPKADNYFQYDYAVDFAPLRFSRPGPTMRVYQLRNCTPR